MHLQHTLRRQRPAVVCAPQQMSETAFDCLYDEYLPFRLYVDSVFGSSSADLAKRYSVSEDWIEERIASIRFCLEKQVRLNLLDRQKLRNRSQAGMENSRLN